MVTYKAIMQSTLTPITIQPAMVQNKPVLHQFDKFTMCMQKENWYAVTIDYITRLLIDGV